MTIYNALKKCYEFLLDSDSIETDNKNINTNSDFPNLNGVTLILGSTGVIGFKLINKLITDTFKGSDFSLVLLKRRDTDTNKLLLSMNEYRLKLESLKNKEFIFDNDISVTITKSIFSSRLINEKGTVTVYEIIHSNSNNWATILEKWKSADKDTNPFSYVLPNYNELTGIVSCLGTTKSQSKIEHITQKSIDYQLNYDIISTISNENITVILLTSFNSSLLSSTVPYFHNKWQLEQDINKKVDFKQLIILRPGPYILYENNSEVIKKNISDIRIMSSQLIALNLYETQLSRFVGYCVKAEDIVKIIICNLYSERKDSIEKVIFIKSKNMKN
ncbi:HIM1-domain-containing protein [Hanseniaspora valbyensis NRRL Y-1626]|uniref:HIM1-domain-containing protein n=1 Tax=Hanseniaspora valbyensis NRRL Y-1626 TaxID=766949 RepID=A0A1B7TCT1_9ASCO|nr:HIM1-domain-containing protein [Hanseniaspora valbyensis NRRL Y-1626]